MFLICSNRTMTNRPASWRMPTPKQMEKLANVAAALRNAPPAPAPGPGDEMPPEYWQAARRHLPAADRAARRRRVLAVVLRVVAGGAHARPDPRMSGWRRNIIPGQAGSVSIRHSLTLRNTRDQLGAPLSFSFQCRQMPQDKAKRAAPQLGPSVQKVTLDPRSTSAILLRLRRCCAF